MSTVAGPELPELPPGAPKFVLTQVKEMERLISRMEKEDSYEMFRTEVDPIDKLKGAGEGGSGGEGGGQGQSPRRRPRKGAGATSDDGMDVDDDGQEGGVEKEQLATEKGDMVPFSDRGKTNGRGFRGATRPSPPPPITLPQIRERFVSGHYLPAPGSYLIQSEESSETTPTAITATATASTTATPCSSSTPADATAASKRSQKKATAEATATASRSRSTSPLLQQAKEAAKEAGLALATAGSDPPQKKEEKEKEKGKEAGTAVVVALTKDKGRLGPNARLTYDYEPLLDWPGLRADVVGLVSRLVQGAEDWRAEKEQARNQRRQKRRRRRCQAGGGGGGGSSGNGDGDGDENASGQKEREGGGEEEEGEDDEDEGVDEYLESATRFSATVEDLVTKQLEKTEKEVSLSLAAARHGTCSFCSSIFCCCCWCCL